MSVTGNIAANINKEQTGNFYFTVVMNPPTGSNMESDSFTLAENIWIRGSEDVSIDDISLLSVQSNYAIITCQLSKNIHGDFKISLTGTVNVNTNGVISEQLLSSPVKIIEYDTRGSLDQVTYDTSAPPASSPTKVDIELSTASIQTGGTTFAQFDFDFDFPGFSENYVDVPSGTVKGNAIAVDDKHRKWIVPVTLPQSGEGEIDIEIDEDALGFQHSPVRAPV